MSAPHWTSTLIIVSLLASCTCDEPDRPAPTSEETPPEAMASVDPEVLLGLEPEVANRVLAEIDGEALTVLDVARELERVGPALAPRLADATERRALVESLVRDRIVAAEARRTGWADEPEVRHAGDEQIARALVAQATADVLPPTDEEVRAYFDAHPDDYRQPERVTLGLIFTRDRERGEEGLRALEADRHHRSETWIHLAEEIGFAGPRTQPVQTTGAFAAVPTVGDAFVPEPVRALAFETTPGELFPELVPYEDGFLIGQVYQRFPAMDLSFEEVREGVRALLHERAVLARTDTIIAEGLASIEVDEAALRNVRLPTEPQRPE